MSSQNNHSSNDLLMIKSLINKRKKSGMSYCSDGHVCNSVKIQTSSKNRLKSRNKNETREHYTCILFLRIDCKDVFREKAAFTNNKIVNDNNAQEDTRLSESELYIKKSLQLLLDVYRSNYYREGVNKYTPNVYSLFDYDKYVDGDKLFKNTHNRENIVRVFKEDSVNIGLHVSLTRNHMLKKGLSSIILKEIIREFEGKVVPTSSENEAGKNNPNPNIAVIKTKIKPFGVYLDMSRVYIYENHNLHNDKRDGVKINGGLYSGVKVDEKIKRLYIDPITDKVDNILEKHGLEKYYQDRIHHVTLFYIKKSDLFLENNRRHGALGDRTGPHGGGRGDQGGSFPAGSPHTECGHAPQTNSVETGGSFGNMIWVDKMVFRIGIIEYTFLLQDQ